MINIIDRPIFALPTYPPADTRIKPSSVISMTDLTLFNIKPRFITNTYSKKLIFKIISCNKNGRNDMIRTCDLYHPKVALYQTELRPDIYYVIYNTHVISNCQAVLAVRPLDQNPKP